MIPHHAVVSRSDERETSAQPQPITSRKSRFTTPYNQFVIIEPSPDLGKPENRYPGPKFDLSSSDMVYFFESPGAVAQLGERYNRTVEVRGSNPLSSTAFVRHCREVQVAELAKI